MALADRKIEAADIVGHRIVDRPDTASNQAETVKGWFDDLVVNFVIPSVNGIIDDFCGIRLAPSSATALPNGVATNLYFTAVEFSYGVSYPTRSADVYTINKDGIYNITLSLGFNASATGDRRIYVLKNSTETIMDSRVNANAISGASTWMNVSFNYSFDSGDTVIIQAYQGSGGVLSTVDPATLLRGQHLSICKIG